MKADLTVDRDVPQSNGPAPPPTRPPPSAARKTSAPVSVGKLRTLPRIVAAKPDGDSATDDAAIDEIRERLLGHLRSAADKMRFCVPEEEKEEPAATPWNLRRRLTAGKAPAEIGAKMIPPPPPPVAQKSQTRSMRSRTAAKAAVEGKEKARGKRKLSVALMKEEIEEDFFLMTGCRPARRPKKRLGKVQRQLDVRNFSIMNYDMLFEMLISLFFLDRVEKSWHLSHRDGSLPSRRWNCGRPVFKFMRSWPSSSENLSRTDDQSRLFPSPNSSLALAACRNALCQTRKNASPLLILDILV